MTKSSPRRTMKRQRPAEPRPSFPLTAHNNGQ